MPGRPDWLTTRRVALALAVVVVLELAAISSLAAHPLAVFGVGTRPGTSFEEPERPWSVTTHYTNAYPRAIETRRNVTVVHGVTANGTAVERFEFHPEPYEGVAGAYPARTDVYLPNGAWYVRKSYPPGSDPANLSGEVSGHIGSVPPDRHVLIAGSRTYRRRWVGGDEPSPNETLRSANETGVFRFFSPFKHTTYTKNGTVQRSGERLTRYEIVREGFHSLPPYIVDLNGALSGYVLVDETDVLHAGRLYVHYESGRKLAVRFERRHEPTTAPAWLERSQSIPPNPRFGHDPAMSQPPMDVEYRNRTAVLVAERRWTPPENTTMFLEVGRMVPHPTFDDEMTFDPTRSDVRVPVSADRSLFRHPVNGTYRTYVYVTERGVVVSDRPPGPNVTLTGEPRIELVEADGVNYYVP